MYFELTSNEAFFAEYCILFYGAPQQLGKPASQVAAAFFRSVDVLVNGKDKSDSSVRLRHFEKSCKGNNIHAAGTISTQRTRWNYEWCAKIIATISRSVEKVAELLFRQRHTPLRAGFVRM